MPADLAWIEFGEGLSAVARLAEPALWGDVVLGGRDLAASYHLAVTVDDALQGVTDVVRGRDLLAATSVHRLLQALLGLPAPRYRHHRLVLDGERGETVEEPQLAFARRVAGQGRCRRRTSARRSDSAAREGRDCSRAQLSFAVAADAGFSTASAAAAGACAISWSIRSRSRLKAASILPSNSRVRASLIAIGSTKLPLMMTS